jgi:hypothetical protein
VNYHLKYLVVAVDICSRFVWVYPVEALDVDRVTNALRRAFSRPEISEQYFHKIRNQVRTITVDGGSEFKKEFPNSLRNIFPNSKFIVCNQKQKHLDDQLCQVQLKLLFVCYVNYYVIMVYQIKRIF